jgi:hypothetical protein
MNVASPLQEAAMANRRRLSHILLWAVLAPLACDVEETATLEVVVRVGPPVDASAFPAQVLIGFDSSGSGYVVFRVGFLCGPPSAPFFTTARFSGPMGGNATSVVDAWLVPLDPGAPVACGPLAAPQPVPRPAPRSAGVQQTSAEVEVLGGCGSGEARSATIVIG